MYFDCIPPHLLLDLLLPHYHPPDLLISMYVAQNPWAWALL